MAEYATEFAPFLTLEGDYRPIIMESQPGDKPGVMKLRVPFYVGDSIAKAPGFKEKIHFPASQLAGIVQEGRDQLAQRQQPITVYARHAHATDHAHLPVGAVVDLTQEDRVGYAILEISPTSDGRDLQELARNGHLNAVSLRSGPGRFALSRKSVNGEPMLQLDRLALDGIDFAPDGPAQPTFGMQILQEAPSVADIPDKHTRSRSVDSLTLEGLRTDHPSLVNEIEAPLRRDLTTITAERDALVAEKKSAAREAKLREIADKFPEPDKAYPILLELCKDAQTDDEVAARAFPVLLEALTTQKAEAVNPKAQLLELFKSSGRGQRTPLGLEKAADDNEINPADAAGIDMAGM